MGLVQVLQGTPEARLASPVTATAGPPQTKADFFAWRKGKRVKFWDDAKSLDVSLYAETESDLAVLHLLRDSVHQGMQSRKETRPR
jgi:hypothetical protein